jgi:hypothetical protein
MPLKKNTSLNHKDTKLVTLFKGHFSGYLQLQRVRVICMIINALYKVRSVNFSKLSSGFDNQNESSSNYRRIQRFFAQVELPMELVAKLIFGLLPDKKSLTLVMDRTNWKLGQTNINVLMLGVSYKNVAFPLMFKLLDKKGNSNTKERIELINDFIKWFGKDCIDSLLADREFVGNEWLNFLNHNSIKYHIRIRNNFKIYCPKRQKEITAWHLFNNLANGELRHYKRIIKMHGEYCYLSGMKSIKDGKLDYCIIVSYKKPEEALIKYCERWQIETLFRGLKTSGFNLENTHVIHLDRLEKLILVVMIAFVWCYKLGDFIDANFKKIKIKKHGNREISVFKHGLEYLSRVVMSNVNVFNINVYDFIVVY